MSHFEWVLGVLLEFYQNHPVEDDLMTQYLVPTICKALAVLRLVSQLFVLRAEAPLKAFLLFFLLPDWLKLNHLKNRMECGFSDIFLRLICSTVTETIGVTNHAASFGSKKCSENHI